MTILSMVSFGSTKVCNGWRLLTVLFPIFDPEGLDFVIECLLKTRISSPSFGEWGIRLENLMADLLVFIALIKEQTTVFKDEFLSFCFETGIRHMAYAFRNQVPVCPCSVTEHFFGHIQTFVDHGQFVISIHSVWAIPLSLKDLVKTKDVISIPDYFDVIKINHEEEQPRFDVVFWGAILTESPEPLHGILNFPELGFVSRVP